MTSPAPLAPSPAALDFLLTRRSRSAKTLGPAAPSREEFVTLLTAAARTPDHGKLEPWRFVVMAGAARDKVAEIARAHGPRAGLDAAATEKAAMALLNGGAVIAVVCSPRRSDKIPLWEQELSAGAVCLSLLNAALAAGWGANWLTGPLARDDLFLGEALGCRPGEFVAGFVHLGNETVVPADRPRPDVEAMTTWL